MNEDIPIRTFLELKNEQQSIRDQLLTNHLVIVKGDETLNTVLRKFNGAKILSAPVLLPNGNYRIISVMDILDGISDISTDVAFTLPISQYCNRAGFIDHKVIHQDNMLREAIEMLGTARRVLVINDNGLPINIISHMDIIAWCAKHLDYIPTGLNQIPAVHIMTTNPVCVKLTDPAFDAFKLCLKMNYTGIGVTDESGKLNSNLSISMLKFLTPDNIMGLLRGNVKQFLENTEGALMKLPKTVKPSDSFVTVLKVMNNNHIHRAYVVDEAKTTGVISVSDVVGLLAKALPQRK